MENFEIAVYVVLAMGALCTFSDFSQSRDEAHMRYPALMDSTARNTYIAVSTVLNICKNIAFMFLALIAAHMMFV